MIEIKSHCGVYILCGFHPLTFEPQYYIGQTRNTIRRYSQHVREGKIRGFRMFLLRELEGSKLLEYERRYIAAAQELNLPLTQSRIKHNYSTLELILETSHIESAIEGSCLEDESPIDVKAWIEAGEQLFKDQEKIEEPEVIE